MTSSRLSCHSDLAAAAIHRAILPDRLHQVNLRVLWHEEALIFAPFPDLREGAKKLDCGGRKISGGVNISQKYRNRPASVSA